MAIGTSREGLYEDPINTDALLRAEFRHVLGDSRWANPESPPLAQMFQEMHAKPHDQRPTALCLSGGGIRSATFCLGVLQWLAGHRQLKDFHYLSTVSGGGYIGSWLVNGMWQVGRSIIEEAEVAAHARTKEAESALNQAADAASENPSPAHVAALENANAAVLATAVEVEELRRVAAAKAAAATADWLQRVGQSAGSVGAASAAGASRSEGDARDPVAPLRAFSNYLSPTGGLSGDAFSLAAIFVRNLLLNAMVWVPLLAAMVALPRLYIAALGVVPDEEWVPIVQWGAVGMALAAIVFGVAYIVADLPAPRDQPAVPTAPSSAAREAAASERTKLKDRFFWACFVPIVLAAIVLSVGGAWIATLRDLPWWSFALAGAAAHMVGVVVGIPVRMARGHRTRPRSTIGVCMVILVGAFGGAMASVALSQLGIDQSAGATESQRLIYASFAVPAMTGAFWLAMALYAGLMAQFTDEQDREWWARATAAWLKFSLLWVAAFLLIGWLPYFILEQVGGLGPTAVQFGVGGGVLGVITSIIGYWSKNGGELKRKAQGFFRATRLKLLDAMAAAVVLTTLLALSMGWSAILEKCHSWSWTTQLCVNDLNAQTQRIREQVQRTEMERTKTLPTETAAVDKGAAVPVSSAFAQVYRHVLLEADWRMLTASITALIMFAALLALAMGVNVFSLHGMYGNRLVRAYLGSGRTHRHPHWFTGFDPDDNPKLNELAAPLREPNGGPRLYLLINIALNIVRPSPQHLDWQQRKAAPFIATPLHCGAATVGFRPTGRYAGGMSLGRAMTISGAAASPNMGYHSSALVTFVMTLFNVRLGWWSPNPGHASGDRWKEDQPWLGLDVAIAEASGSTGVDDPFVYLSDGGHFDNLGIYEMVRRRCRRIVAVDATCDGNFTWTDLLEVVRKVRVDFGIPIELPAVLPGPKRTTAHYRHIEAPIRYSARDGNDPVNDGMLIVLKPRLQPRQDPPEISAYAIASAPDGTPLDDPARFPHQSTADQFFDEQQFESYRLLGYLTAQEALGEGPINVPSAALEDSHATTVAGAGGDVHPAAVSPITSGLAGLAGGGGIGQFVQQVGTGAALATALTIGGTLGVVGTVGLRSTELTLSEADRALLKGGMPLRVDAAELKLDDADRQMLRSGLRVTSDGAALDGPAGRLAIAASELSTAATKLGSVSATMKLSADDSLLRLVNDLQAQIRLLRERIGSTATSPELARIVVVIEKRLETIESRLPTVSDERALASALDGIKSALGDLKTSVDNIAPNRNVRGQDGGSR